MYDKYLRNGFPSRTIHRICRVMPERNIKAGWMLLLVTVLAVGWGWGADHVQAEQAKPEQEQAKATAPIVDEADASRLYRYLELAAEGEMDKPFPKVMVRDVAGVRIDLRWQGLPVGIHLADAEAWLGDGNQVVDLGKLSQQVLGAALSDLERALKLKAANAGRVPTAEEFENIRKQLLIDYQIARSPKLIAAPGALGEEAIYDDWAWGYHGIAVTGGEGTEGKTLITWPGTVQANNLGQRSMIRRLMTDAGYDMVSVEKQRKAFQSINRSNGPRVERFEVIHLNRAGRGKPITSLERGVRYLPEDAIRVATIDSMAERMIDHLSSKVRDDGSLAGTYLPSRNRNDPADASLREIALVSYVAAHRGRWLAEKHQNPRQPALVQANRLAMRTAKYLIFRWTRNQADITPEVGSLLLLAICESAELSAEQKSLRDRLAASFVDLQNDQGYFVVDHESGKLLDEPVQGLITLALATYYRDTGDAAALRAVNRARSVMWTKLDGEKLFNTMPWLGMAEVMMQTRDDAEQPGVAVRQAIVAEKIRALGKTLLSRQVRKAPKLGPKDVLGGILFDPTQAQSSAPNPTWQTSYGLSLFSLGLRTQGVIENKEMRDEWIVGSAMAARFLGQLMFDSPSCFYSQSGEETLGGVKAALFDNQLAAPPTAMSILSLTEMQRALEEQ